MELQEAEELELEVDSSQEEENKGKLGSRSSEMEAATKGKPERELLAERHGAHVVLERDQQEEPWS